MTFFPNSKGIQFFFGNDFSHSSYTHFNSFATGNFKQFECRNPHDPLTDYLMMQVEFFPL